MVAANEPLSASILAIMYVGDVVFAVSGALNAARHRRGPPGEFIRIENQADGSNNGS